MGRCNANGCDSRPRDKRPGISFHKFPKNPERRAAWLKAMQISDWQPTNGSRICSKHFEEKFINRTMTQIVLRDDAMPTIFPFRDSDQGEQSSCDPGTPDVLHPHTVLQTYLSVPRTAQLDNSTAVTKICCTCLSFDVEMLSLSDAGIRECLEKVTNIKIDGEEELLQNVCTECVSTMQKFVLFRDKCLKANQKLRQMLSQYTHIPEAVLQAENMKLCSENSFSFNEVKIFPDTNIHNFLHERESKFDFGNASHNSESRTNLNIDSLKDGNSDNYIDESELKIDYDIMSDTSESQTNLKDSNLVDYIDESEIKIEYDVISDVSESQADLNIQNLKDINLGNYMDESESKKSIGNMSDHAESETDSNINSFKGARLGNSPQHVRTCTDTQDNPVKYVFVKSNFAQDTLPQEIKFVGSIKKKTLLDKKKPLWKSDYAVQITLTKDQQREELSKREMSETYSNAPFKCSDCVTGFKSRENFGQHMEMHDESRGVWQCDVCKLRYCNLLRLRLHQTSHSKRYKCLSCGEITKTQKQAMRHKKRHLGIVYDTCEVCNTRFKNEFSYRRHIRKAHPTDYVCELCGDYFTSQVRLSRHKEARADCRKTPAKIYKCEICDEQSSTLNSWYIHMLKHAREKDQTPPTECQVCRHKTTTWNDWSYHIVYEHRNKNVNKNVRKKPANACTCDVCGKTILGKSKIAEHIRLQHMDGNAVSPHHKFNWRDACKICNKNILRYNMWRHMRTHTGERPYVCDVCGTCFAQATTMRRHVRVVHKVIDKSELQQEQSLREQFSEANVKKYNFHCQQCPKKFTTKQYLNKHEMSHTAKQKFSCDVCQRSYVSKHFLGLHKKMHATEKPLTCDVCERTFICKRSLEAHILLHMGKKPYSCDLCQRTYVKKYNLALHKKIHTGEEVFSCDVCKREYSSKHSLEFHKKLHTGEKPYACDLCDKKFAYKIYLETHVTNHRDERPFACDVCGKRFNLKANLQRHKQIHTGVKNWTCDLCGKTFTQSSSLKLHTNTVHLKLPHPPRKPRKKKE